MSTLLLVEQAAPDTPSANQVIFYAKSDGIPYAKDDAGTERAIANATTGTTSSTFTFNGSGGSTGSLTLTWQKTGNWITLNIPAAQATTGTTSTVLTSNTALAATARPTTNQDSAIMIIRDNGAGVAPAGLARVLTSGIIELYRDGSGAAFTNAASGGTNTNTSVTYFVG